MPMSVAQDPDLVAGVYAAAAHPDRWNHAWAAVCHAFDAENGVLFEQDNPSAAPRILAATNWEDSAPRLFGEFYRQADAQAGSALAGMSFRDSYGHLLTTTVALEGAARAGLGLHRATTGAEFASSDRAALDGVARHVAAALRLEKLLTEERLASAMRGAALDHYSHGAVIVDSQGAILFANDRALRLAATGGLVLGAAGEGLSCDRPNEADRLATLIYRAAARGEGGTTRITRAGRHAILAATVEPLALATGAGRRLVLVTIHDLGATSDAAQTDLIGLFGLTGAEAAIVPQLLAGDSAALIAQSRGVTVATIRAQAARVLAKTGAANLRALASMIAALGCA
jgi:DNA-binding CsgD family transcriptional regulator